VPNFTPIGEAPAEKTVTEQKTHSKLSIPEFPTILRMGGIKMYWVKTYAADGF